MQEPPPRYTGCFVGAWEIRPGDGPYLELELELELWWGAALHNMATPMSAEKSDPAKIAILAAA